ncbi:MAG: type II secretion system F family protein [Lachnospiraceae bacterium]|nr:type II secretion system F family protein [Lachnospiraceae bacterium]
MEKLYEVLFANMETAHLQWITWSIAVFICGLTGYLMYRIYGKFKLLQETNYGQRLYEAAEDSFRHGNRDRYEKLQKWLKSIGAEFAVKGFGDPFQFVVINLILVVVVLVIFSALSDLVTGFLVAVALVATELLMLVLIDQKNNKEMLDDVSFLYDATAIQLTSNIYMVEAISNCLLYISNKRLKQALTELCGNLSLGGDVRAATKDFSEKFHNEYLDTFCGVIIQVTTETGEAGKLIEDMSKQLSVLKETNFASQKKATENKLQLCIIGIFIVFTVLIFYLCIVSMTGSADILF